MFRSSFGALPYVVTILHFSYRGLVLPYQPPPLSSSVFDDVVWGSLTVLAVAA